MGRDRQGWAGERWDDWAGIELDVFTGLECVTHTSWWISLSNAER